MEQKIYHLHALSALHCGTGQSVGVIDLPIARDRATNLPLVPGSSLRGVLRDHFSGEDEKLETTLFGPRRIGGVEEAFAGALALGDAHLLLLPIRALAGVVAYATCPFILKRYKKSNMGLKQDVPNPGQSEAIHAQGNLNIVSNKVVLEELDLTPKENEVATKWARDIAEIVFPGDTEAQDDLIYRFLILPDSVFSFLAETAMEIRTRITVDNKSGIVKKGALWYEENLPAESILWGIYALSPSRSKDKPDAAEALAKQIPQDLLLQLGGKAGVGRGLTRFLANNIGEAQ